MEKALGSKRIKQQNCVSVYQLGGIFLTTSVFPSILAYGHIQVTDLIDFFFIWMALYYFMLIMWIFLLHFSAFYKGRMQLFK